MLRLLRSDKISGCLITLSSLLSAALCCDVGVGLVSVHDLSQLVQCHFVLLPDNVPILELELICTEHNKPVSAASTQLFNAAHNF